MFSAIAMGLLVAVVLVLILLVFLLISVHRLNFKAYPATVALLVMTRNSPLHWVTGIAVVLCVGIALFI